MKKKHLYIANWKAYLSYQQAIAWCKKHADELKELSTQGQIIICPDFLALPEIKNIIKPVAVGAQNCSAQSSGPYTGEVTAQSLQEAGATYCIIGHSERRKLCHETPADVAQKMEQLFACGITPVVCVSDEGELASLLDTFSSATLAENTRTGRIKKNTVPTISSGADMSVEAVAKSEGVVSRYESTIILAYEPVSAIGTGNVPPAKEIEKMLALFKEKISAAAPTANVSLLYGGSVNAKNAAELKKITNLDGFLIGKASTDFEELKKIVIA